MNEFAKKLKEMTTQVNNAIVFLENHHCNTNALRKSMEEFIEINELIITDLKTKVMNLKAQLSTANPCLDIDITGMNFKIKGEKDDK